LLYGDRHRGPSFPLGIDLQELPMRHHYILAVIAGFITVVFGPVHAAERPVAGTPPPLGLRAPTPEEEAAYAAHASAIAEVGLNALGRRRVAAFLKVPEAGVASRPMRLAAVGSIAPSPAEAPPTYTLPDKIDNSLLDAFPPIGDQGGLGSCASFCTTYYMLTHMTALARGWNAKTGGNAVRFSTRLTYNMINGGNNFGSSTNGAITFQYRHGGLTLAEWPYDGNYRIWPTQASQWRAALGRRIGAYGTISGFNTEAGLNVLRQLLVNGHVLTFGTGNPAYDWPTRTMGSLQIVYVNLSGTGHGLHAMTIVGYDDALWCDVNGNGVEDPGERGALKIANSWGVSNGWGMNQGFYWVAYDALRHPTAVAGWTPPANRSSAFSSADWILARDGDYRPELVGEFTVRHPKRGSMYLRVGKSDPGGNAPTTIYSDNNLSWAGGPYAFDGTTTVRNGSFVLDCSPLPPDLNVPKRYYLTMGGSDGGGEDRIVSFALKNADGTILATSPNTPLNVNDGVVHAYADLIYVNGSSPSVTLEVLDGMAREFDLHPAAVRVRRTGTTGALRVNLEVGGTASSNEYYLFLGTEPVAGTVVIPDGQDHADLLIKPIDDRIREDRETVVLRVGRSPDYQIGTPSEAVVCIEDNDNVQIQVGTSVAGVAKLYVPENGTATTGVRLTAAPASDVTVTITRTYGTAILVSAATLTFTPANWNTWQVATFTEPHDADTTSNSSTFLFAAGPCESQYLFTYSVDDETPQAVLDAGWIVVPEGGAAPVRVRMTCDPGQATAVRVRFAEGDRDLSVVGPADLQFDSANWNVWQTVTLAAAEDLDGYEGSARFTVETAGKATIEFVAVEREKDPSGIAILTSASTCQVQECRTGSFQVKLSGPPPAPVVVQVARVSGDPDITVVSGSSLAFDADTWNTWQPVTLAAAQDPDVEAGEAVIECLISGVAQATVLAVESDGDRVTFECDTWAVFVPEGGTASFRVRLGSRPIAPLTAMVARSGGDPDIGVVSGASLFFTPDTWDQWQTVVLSAAVDADAVEGFASIQIQSGGMRTTISAYEIEKDAVAIVPDAGRVTLAENGTGRVNVRLSRDPAAPVTVTASLSGGAGSVAITAGATLAFDSTNWMIWQPVVLSGIHDADMIDASATLSLAGVGATRNISVTVLDDERVSVLWDPLEPSVPEGGTADVRFRLSGAPTADVSVSLWFNGGDPDLRLAGLPAGTTNLTLTFTPATWNVWQAVTLSAAHDADTFDGWAYLAYSALSKTGYIRVREVDDDPDGTPPLAGTVNDGPGADIDSQTETTSIRANWTGFYDPESGITSYAWAIGTTPGGQEVQPFTDVGPATRAAAALSLTGGTTSYVTVRAANGKGLTVTASSDGVTIGMTDIAVPLASGYTLIALPLDPATTLTAEALAQQINGQGGQCTSVIAYEGGAFVTHPVGTAVNNFPIAAGRGYFVRCAQGSTWRVTGYRFNKLSRGVSLDAGYTLVGLPIEPAAPGKYTAEGAGIEINAQGGGATQLIRYDEQTGQFATHPVGTAVSNFTLDLGRGYFVRCTKKSDWIISR
jgi:hypothetical protein